MGEVGRKWQKEKDGVCLSEREVIKLEKSSNNFTIHHVLNSRLKLWKSFSVFDDYKSQPDCCPQQLSISPAKTLEEIQDPNQYSPALAQDIEYIVLFFFAVDCDLSSSGFDTL